MNLQLLDPFEQDFPEVIEDTLEDGPAVTVRFNRRGTLLAAGCSDGTIVVWDFDTRGVSRSLIGHVKTVSSLSWSRNGRYLLSASRDWSCIVWDLLTGTKKHTIRFDTPVLNAQFHPKNDSIFIAALHQEKPVFVDFSNGVHRSPIIMEPNNDDSSDQNAASMSTPTPATAGTGQMVWTLVATFDKQGKKIYTGSNRGQISIIGTESRTLLHEIRPTTSAIKSIQFSRRGKEIVVNANDRIIRLFETKEDGPPEQLHKFQDLVNRIQWNQCCFSSDSDYVIGGSAHQAEHNIYIWDKSGGNLVKILEGPKEPLEDLAWHPIRPIVASVSSYGTIHIWATNYQENWSAFAPDFKELEENIDYEEREDEFDIVPEEEASKRKHDDEDVLIDVTTIEKINPFNDSDSEDGEEETFYLPLLPSDQQNTDMMHHKHHRQRNRTSRHHNHLHNNNASSGSNSHHHHRRHEHSHLNPHSNSQLKNDASFSPPMGRISNHAAHNSHNGTSIRDETLDHSLEERRRDHGERDKDREHEHDGDYPRDHDRERDRDRDRERDRDTERRRERDRDREDRQHKPKEQSEDQGHEFERRDDHGYGNGRANGGAYDRERDRDRDRDRDMHNASARRRLEDHQPSARSIKRQR